jgi:hypothetical protein
VRCPPTDISKPRVSALRRASSLWRHAQRRRCNSRERGSGLYLVRCGWSASVPSRRLRSASYASGAETGRVRLGAEAGIERREPIATGVGQHR